jgi:hypothetical protein
MMGSGGERTAKASSIPLATPALRRICSPSSRLLYVEPTVVILAEVWRLKDGLSDEMMESD